MSREKHLEFIQGVINRHNSNSFMLKGWAVTLSAALYALAGTIQESDIVLIAFAPILLFWGLDAFYLSNEKCFVDLYNSVALGSFKLPQQKMYKKDFSDGISDPESGVIPNYNMNFKKFEIWKDNSWFTVLKSKTIISFYLSMVGLTIALLFLLSEFEDNKQRSINVNATIQPSNLELMIKSDPPTIINNVYPSDSSNNSTSTKSFKKN